jgi:SAM-dependent methyltransferase
MSTVPADEGNAEQIAFWNGPGGRRWADQRENVDLLLKPIATATLARAAVKPGERVVDIGCGCGGTTIELAKSVGPTGRVLGVDVSRPMLARARERLPPGLPVELAQADATTYPFPRAGFDLLFSRMGVMFFADPARSFANLRTALHPGGRLVFACFRTPRENPWMMVPLEAAYQHVPPLQKLGPEDPGPFSFASEGRVRLILGRAGFLSVTMEPLDLELDLGGGRGLDAAVASSLEIGATSRAVDGQPPAIRSAAMASIRRALEPYQRGAAVPLGAAVWLVGATSTD